MRVLVTAASRYGSTAEIAHAIGDVLGSSGITATVAPPETVGGLARFDAVVLGSPVYVGHWLPAAIAPGERIGKELPSPR